MLGRSLLAMNFPSAFTHMLSPPVSWDSFSWENRPVYVRQRESTWAGFSLCFEFVSEEFGSAKESVEIAVC